MKTLFRAAFALVLMVSATSLHAQNAPPAPKPAFDPAGFYEMQISFGGQSMAVTMELYKANGAWAGTAGSATTGMANVTAVTVEGRNVRVSLNGDGTPYTVNITVKEDNTVTGKWEGNGDGSPLTGKKTK